MSSPFADKNRKNSPASHGVPSNIAASNLANSAGLIHVCRAVERENKIVIWRWRPNASQKMQEAEGGANLRAAYRLAVVLPTKKKYGHRRRPHSLRLRFAVSLVVKNQLDIASVTMRLISSGIVQSPDLMPPSTCATFIPIF